MSWIGPNALIREAGTVERESKFPVKFNRELLRQLGRYPGVDGAPPSPEPPDPLEAIAFIMCRLLGAGDLVEIGQSGASLTLFDTRRAKLAQLKFAFLAARFQAVLRLRVIDKDAADHQTFTRVTAAFETGADDLRLAVETWLGAVVRPLDASKIDGATPFSFVRGGPSDGIEVRAYLASSLTNTGEEERAHQLMILEAISWLLAQHGIRSYIPALNTSPHDDGGSVSEVDIHRIDYDAVLNADVLVAYGFPSLGAGKELAWADNHRSLSVIVPPPDTRVSRLPLGAPSGTILLNANGEDPAQEIVRVIFDNESRIWAHAVERRRLATQFDSILNDLRSCTQRTSGSLLDDPSSLLTPARASEIVLSGLHLQSATLGEILELERHSGIDVLSRINPGPVAKGEAENSSVQAKTESRPDSLRDPTG